MTRARRCCRACRLSRFSGNVTRGVLYTAQPRVLLGIRDETRQHPARLLERRGRRAPIILSITRRSTTHRALRVAMRLAPNHAHELAGRRDVKKRSTGKLRKLCVSESSKRGDVEFGVSVPTILTPLQLTMAGAANWQRSSPKSAGSVWTSTALENGRVSGEYRRSPYRIRENDLTATNVLSR